MATIGERLRAAREAKGLQLDDAHRQTKIHARILQAMEEDHTGEVLDTAYAKGFLKKYAAFLDLDPTPLVNEYLQTAQSPSPGPVAAGPEAETSAPVPRWLLPTAVGIMALVGVAFLGILARDLYQAVSTAAATPRIPKPATPPSHPPSKAPAPSLKLLVPKLQPLKLSIKAAQDCWMQVKVDDKVLFQSILGKGREETWTAAEGIELWVGNAAALTLTLNGRPLEPLGSGVVRGIRVTRYGVQPPKDARSAP